MIDIAPLETLYDSQIGENLPFPAEVENFYGQLRFPAHPERPYVIGNLVATLDGVVALEAAGNSGGPEIRGQKPHDRVIMGILRAVSDAVIVGAGTFRQVPSHIWTAEHIYRPLSDSFSAIRKSLGRKPQPLNVFVSSSGQLDPNFPVFHTETVPVMILTTKNGLDHLRQVEMPSRVQVLAVDNTDTLSAKEILQAVLPDIGNGIILVEGGPHLIGTFFNDHLLDELFLTLAPQIAGRDDIHIRPGFSAGKQFAPENPIWAKLIGVKRSDDHLFLRYSFK